MFRFTRQVVVLMGTIMTLINAGGAHAQEQEFFEGCGTLRVTRFNCLSFFPDHGNEFPNGIGRLGGWEEFGEGDHIFVSGELVVAGTICDDDAVLSKKSEVRSCPPVPAISTWGTLILGLMFLGMGSVAIRLGRRWRTAPTLLAVVFALGYLPLVEGQAQSVDGRVRRMLADSHHPKQLLVRFKPGSSQVDRGAVHVAAGGVALKRYRLDPDLTLVHVADGNLERALAAYLRSEHTLRAEPDYDVELLTVPDDEYFCAQWALQNNGGEDLLGCIGGPAEAGTQGSDIRATYAWDLWTGNPELGVAQASYPAPRKEVER